MTIVPGSTLKLTVLLASAAAAGAANFHPITGVTSDTAGTDFFPAVNLIEGRGTGFDAAVPHGRTSGLTWVTNAPNGGSGDYFSPLPTPAPRLVFDLGQNRNLTEISVWGYADTNANGARAFSLRFATSAEGPAGFGGSIGYSPSFNPVQPSTPRQSFAFSQTVSARYVELKPTDNFFGINPPGGDRVGLGEVAFEDAVPPNDPDIDLPDSLALDLDGSVQSLTVPVGNLGVTRTLNLTGTSFTGTNAGAFSTITLPDPIAPGGSDQIWLSFNPTGLTGAINANLVVSSNDAATPTVTVAMTGFLHDPKLLVAPSLNFGSFPTGSGTQNTNLAISNAGAGQNLAFSSITVTGPGAENFSVTSFPASLAPLAAGQVALAFTPQIGDGSYTAVLRIESNDALAPVVNINLIAAVGDAVPGSGVRINEFMASNATTLDDGDGNPNDWIEIYNAGPGAADLSGWFLTDTAGNLTKWAFPDGTVVAENAFLIVFASGQNTDTYIDSGGYRHTNFRLSAGGEYLGLVRPDGSSVVSAFTPTFPPQFTDIAYGTFRSGGSTANAIANANAAVHVPSSAALGATWTFPAFVPDGSWNTSGTGTGVGYDSAPDYDPWIDIDVETILRGINASIYIRIPFPIADKSAVTAMSFAVRYDDGFVAYLNGTEIASRSAPAAPVWNSTATGNATEPLVLETIDSTAFLSALVNGPNVLAIQGLNATPGSSDFVIDPALLISLSGSGPLSTGYLAEATPGTPNTGEAAIPGPEISEVTHTPTQPAPGQSLTVTAAVAARLAAVAGVTLRYRADYGAETSVAMRDDGTAPDAAAGDGVYTGTIPSSAYVAGDMVRWKVVASDVDANDSRSPAFLDQSGNNQSPEYFGTVVSDPSVTSGMPIFQWFSQNPSAGHTRSGARVSVYFAGRFYDNIFARQRGGATNGSASQKFDFNKGNDLYIDETMPSVREINMNGNGSDTTYVRQPLAFEAYRTAGNAGCNSALWLMRVNGGTDRVGVFVEQVDDDFLKRNGYDPEGELYKMVQRGNLNPVFFDTITGIEKKTGDPTDFTSIESLVAGLNQATGDARRRYAIDHLDLPQILTYLAVRSITQDADDVRKNFYVYQDSRGDGRWRIFPWDKDWTFGITGDGGTWLPHPFFGDQAHAKQNANQWNVLLNVVFNETTTQRLYLRRLRTLMDTQLQPASTPLAERYFETRAVEIITPASPPLGTNLSAVNSYLTSRRSVLFNNYPSLIPAAQPANPDIVITGADYNPASGNQDHEYIVLANNEATEIDISGWTLTDGVEFTFAPGTVIERGGNLYVSPDTLAFRQRPTSPTGNEERLVVGPFSGHLSNFGETVVLSDTANSVVSTYMTPVNPSPAQVYLVVSEIMYHPADTTPDAEFIEVMNISNSVTLDLGGVRFTSGIHYAFPPDTMLAPGARLVVGFSDFQNGSRLNNGSDRIKLEDATGSTIRDFSYDDNPPWPTAPDGGGPSLVLIQPKTNPDPSLATSWRSSTTNGGNPGTSDALPYTGGDLVTYALPSAPTILVGGGNPILEYKYLLGAEDVTVMPEWSDDLATWSADGLTALEETSDGAGVATAQWSLPSGESRFARLRVTQR
jgi:hypothetical protein